MLSILRATAAGLVLFGAANAAMIPRQDNAPPYQPEDDNSATSSSDASGPNFGTTPPDAAFALDRRQGYTSGQCGFHLHHEWQAGLIATTGPAFMQVTLYDGAQQQIGQLARTQISDGQGFDVTSALPWTVHIISHDTGETSVGWYNHFDFEFAYAGTTWRSTDPDQSAPAHCSVGKADVNVAANQWATQDMDCVFPC